jgi:hypothetical protein
MIHLEVIIMKIFGFPISSLYFPLFIRHKNISTEESIKVFNKLLELIELAWNPDIDLLPIQAIRDFNEKFNFSLDVGNSLNADLELIVLFADDTRERYLLFKNVMNYKVIDGNGEEYEISLFNYN